MRSLKRLIRVKADMNYQLTENMVEYEVRGYERLLYNLGLAGSGFKKVYYMIPNHGAAGCGVRYPQRRCDRTLRGIAHRNSRTCDTCHAKDKKRVRRSYRLVGSTWM